MSADLPPAGQDVAAPPPRWTLRLLGALQCSDGHQSLQRLPSRAVAALLARLALWPARDHAREELVELLWPGVALDVGRNRLRQALSALRSQLEPPGGPARPVLLADRLRVRLVPGSVACDVHRFEALVRAGRQADALAVYGGELLPGFYDEWINDERQRLAILHADCLADSLPATAPAAPATRPPSKPPPDTPPPWPPDGGTEASVAPAARSIPHYLTRLFGAEAQVAQLQRLVQDLRLVTLLGPGGAGKTRLAAELARRLSPALSASSATHFDTVAFVPLVACTRADEVDGAVQAALHLGGGLGRKTDGTGGTGETGAGGDPGALTRRLTDRRSLLVLDNVEQLDRGALALLLQWLDRLPQLHLLLTSRRLLGLDGEHPCTLAPLPVPAPDADLAGAAANPALALFLDRARTVRADFHLGPGNLATLVALVRALDGLPLALELAASRVRSVPPAQLLQRLTTPAAPGQTPGLDLLARSGPRAAADPRHASMTATLDWSWTQLDGAAQQVLKALTTFADGCPAEALAALCPALDTALQLDTLQAASLVRLQAHGADDDAGPRVSLPEPLREYAAARLPAEAAQALHQRQRQWWLQWAASLGPTPSLRRVRREMPNLAAALVRAVDDGAAAQALQLALALRPALTELALPSPAVDALARALTAAGDANADTASRAHALVAWLRFEAGDRIAAQSHADQALALAPPGSAARARALHAVASLRWRSTRRPDGLAPLLDEAAGLAQQQADLSAQASVLALRAFITNVAHRDPAGAQALHRQALALWQQQGNVHVINGGLYNLAVCATHAGRHAEALQRLDAVCRTAQAHEDWEQLADALNLLGHTRIALRDWPGAVAALRACVQQAWSTGALHALAYGLWNLPRALAHTGQPEAAAQLMGFAATFWQRHFGALSAADRLDQRRVGRLVGRSCGPAAGETLQALGAAMSAGDAVRLALSASERPQALAASGHSAADG
jgi:predicted ATPase